MHATSSGVTARWAASISASGTSRPISARSVERDRPRRALVARDHHAAQVGQARAAGAAHLGHRVEEVLGAQARDRDQGADAAVGQHVLELARP